ncbi:type I-B CRISPR-associated protein Cas8b1/Cst1 [Thermolongibacillus altinsuensis]
MALRLYLEDWLYNAGIVGIINILEKAAEMRLVKTNHYVEIPIEALERFPDYYFQYFCNKYERMTSWYKIVSQKPIIDHFKMETFDEKQLDQLNKMIEYTRDKLTSNSYKNTYHLIGEHGSALLEIALRLKKIQKKKKESVQDIWDKVSGTIHDLQKIITHLQAPISKKYIRARNIIYDLIQNYWEGVSFLHKNANKDDMYEAYYHYFIQPVLVYLEQTKNEKQKPSKYHCFTCGNKITKLSDSYELTWLNKTGVDSSRKSSHFWNYQPDAYICPICNFVYSCVPAGFTFSKGKGIFINENSNMKRLYGVNQMALENVKSFEELEQKSYFYILDSFEQVKVDKAEKEIQNIQIVKMDHASTNTLYSFNILSRDRLKVISKNKERLKKLIGIYVKEDKYHMNVYHEVITRLYQNRNQYDLIDKLFRLLMNEKFKRTSIIRHILYINHQFINEGKKGSMIGYQKIKNFQQYGLDLRKEYKDQSNKLPGIIYRLLNALKLKNEANFIHIVVNAYMYKNKKVPLDFIEVLHDKEKFQTIGYAFLLGLQGDNDDDVKEEKRNE